MVERVVTFIRRELPYAKKLISGTDASRSFLCDCHHGAASSGEVT